MPVKKGVYWVLFGSVSAVLAGVLFSRALLSIGVYALFLTSLFDIVSRKVSINFRNIQVLVPLTFLLLTLLGFYRIGELPTWVKDVEISLLWLCFMLGLTHFLTACKPIHFSYLRSSFYFIVNIVGLVSVIHYLLNMEEINQLLLQSKHIPIFGGMHHIYFGVLNALLVLTKITEWLLGRNRAHSIWLKMEDTSAWLIFVWLHVLSSRTGLYSFYLIIPFIIGLGLFKFTSIRKKIVWVAIPLLIMPIVSYTFFPSFKNKIANTAEDISATQVGDKQVNYKSLGMRFEAWETALSIVKTYPLMGVGAGNVEEAMKSSYEKRKSVLVEENRIGPHNQFLEYAIKFGLMGAFVLLLYFVASTFKAFRDNNLILLSLLAFLFLTCMLESMLERQQGVILFSLLVLLGGPLSKND